jgi:phage baseplate assembly protein V
VISISHLFGQLSKPISTRIANMVARATVKLVDDSKKIQILQVGVLKGETRSEIERFQNLGFTSVPEEGAEAVVLFVGGRRDHGYAVAVDDRRYRLKDLEPGEVAMYHKSGSKIVMKANGDIEVTADANVKINGGSTPVAKEGSATTGHMHTLTGTAGPFPLAGTAITTTDSIATAAGSATVKVP